jgi:hypothetical protein
MLDKNQVPSKSDVVKFLSDHNTRALTYHNHKEASAWGGVVFFYAFASVLIGLIEKKIGSKIILGFWALLSGVFISVYVHIQLGLRRYMSNLTLVLPRVCTKILAMSTEDFAKLDWSLRGLGEPETGNGTLEFHLPNFVVEEYNLAATKEHLSRWRLELYPLLLIAVAGFVVLDLLYLSKLPLF